MIKQNKPHINLIVLGHVNTGKSTLTGHTLWKLGGVDEKTVLQTEKEANEGQRSSYQYSWLVDQLKEEREKGHTIDICLQKFQTPKYFYTVMDAPGLRQYMKNMISGTAAADVGILVVAAPQTEHEEGMADKGQTKEQALIAYTLGVKQLIVVINKMDEQSVDWSEPQYNLVKGELSLFLRRTGYHSESLSFIPMSAFYGDNLIERSSNSPWYKGKTLVEALDAAVPPKQAKEKPLRLPIQDVYKIAGIGTVAVGRLATGILQKNSLIWISPANISAQVRSIETHKRELPLGEPGDNIGFNIKNINFKDIRRGDVASDNSNEPAREATSFTAMIIVMNHPGEIAVGYTPVVDCHTTHVACKFSEIQYTMNRLTGQIDNQEPKSIQKGDAALVTLVPSKPMCVEVFQEFPQLGRIIIRDMDRVVGVGVIQSVVQKEPLKK